MSRPKQPDNGVYAEEFDGSYVVYIDSWRDGSELVDVGTGATELSATNAAIRNTEKILKMLKASSDKLEREANK